ncbi:MAG: hypothetical protein IBX57_00385 [Gammaproteobacteria bacterium]|nr:hypothetical protein [Gammaproteobacteria bacterium]
MFTKLLEIFLFKLLAKRLGVAISGKTKVCDLDLSDYTRRVFADHKLGTVAEVLLTYSLNHNLPGVGDKTWQDFFSAVK